MSHRSVSTRHGHTIRLANITARPCKEALHENAEIYWTDSCTTNKTSSHITGMSKILYRVHGSTGPLNLLVLL